MKISFLYFDKLPIAIIDNFYTNEELNLLGVEINFLLSGNDKFLSAELSNSALDPVTNKPLRRSKTIVLDKVYIDRNISNILAVSNKIFDDEIIKLLVKEHGFFRFLKHSNQDCTKLHLYLDNDGYDKHTDGSVITSLSWLFDNPKNFEGGDLEIENSINIECVFNRTVLIPSLLLHKVTDIKILNNEHSGRFCIAKFIGVSLDEFKIPSGK